MLGAWRIGAIAALVNVKFADELDYYFADHAPKVVIYTHDMLRAGQRGRGKVRLGPPSGLHGRPAGGRAVAARADGGRSDAAARPVRRERDRASVLHLGHHRQAQRRLPRARADRARDALHRRAAADRARTTSRSARPRSRAPTSSSATCCRRWPRGAAIHVMGRWTQPTGWDALDAARRHHAGRQSAAARRGARREPHARPHARPAALRPVRRRPGAADAQGRLARRAEAAAGRKLRPERAGRLRGAWLSRAVAPTTPSSPRIGPPLPDKEVRIFGTDDGPLPLGEVGEIVLRGGFMAGYWGKPEKTEEATRGGWLRTGDLGLIDARRLRHHAQPPRRADRWSTASPGIRATSRRRCASSRACARRR